MQDALGEPTRHALTGRGRIIRGGVPNGVLDQYTQDSSAAQEKSKVCIALGRGKNCDSSQLLWELFPEWEYGAIASFASLVSLVVSELFNHKGHKGHEGSHST